MSKKSGLSVTQIKMYENMVHADFEELMGRVQEYRSALQDQARVEVSKEKGLFELKILAKKLELQLDEVKAKIKQIAGSKYSNKPEFEDAIDRRVSVLLGTVADGSLADIEATYNHFVRKVRLAGLTDEVRGVFETELPARLKELTAAVKQLPPPPKVNKDELLLTTLTD